MESQPKNPEFRNNPENFHPCIKQYMKERKISYAPRHLPPMSMNTSYHKEQYLMV